MTIDFPRVRLDQQSRDVRVRGREWNEHHAQFRELAEATGEYAGIPMDLTGFSLVLEERHPHKADFERILSHPEPDPIARLCSTTDVDETMWVRNTWYSRIKQAQVYLYQSGDGPVKVTYDRTRRSPGRRITFTLMTLGAQQAWNIDCEMRAREKLARLIPTHLYEMYELAGGFMWTSKRSGVTYVFRRCRPTIAMVPMDRHDDEAPMKILAVLCLHPLGYYADTYAGSMVPTDDVVAHFLLASGDEHGFWRRANQHPFDTPEAGI